MSEIISTIVEICKQNPSRIAIKYMDKSVNYGELDIQSSRLAQYFQQLGLQKGDHIGVILERSIDLIVTIVAIMRSGAVYVPIDPASPIERIRNIIEDSDLKAVIVSDNIPCQALCNTIIRVYSSSFCSLTSMLTEEEPKINGNDSAYIIYTSGTTGAAKGVVISHDNLSALFEATSNKALFSLTSEDRWSFFSSHAFDFSIWEIFGALYYGALLVIVPTTLTKDPAAFYQFMIAEKITIFSNTPSFFYQIIDSAITDPLSQCSLRYIVFGGEALNFGLLKPWCNKYGLDNIKLINMYGITEATVHTTYHRITEEDLSQPKSIIGKPLGNAEIYLLDENKNTIDLGEMGELYISGRGVAQGYYNQLNLTDSVFISNKSINGRQLPRLYRTGDLGRQQENGNIEYLGRVNNQVKIRGYRIECGAVESVLNSFHAVQQSYVCKKEFGFNDVRLVAYILPNKTEGQFVRNILRLRHEAKIHDIKNAILPNEIPVFYLNGSEKDYMYNEIFNDSVYLKNGITINDGDVIFDVGANIGMFSLFASTMASHLKILAFEPIKEIYDVLTINSKILSDTIHVFQLGLGNTEGPVEFTYIPQVSVMSSIQADAEYNRSLLRNTLSNHFEKQAEMHGVSHNIDDYINAKLKSKIALVQLTTLSTIIAQHNIVKIDLLKIDVEKSELDVLKGIKEKDWEKIKQVVIEVHGQERQQAIIKLLQKHNFDVISEVDSSLVKTDIINLYAVQKRTEGGVDTIQKKCTLIPNFFNENAFLAALKSHCQLKLMPYMIPSHFIFVDEIPRTINGKLDVERLPRIEFPQKKLPDRTGWTVTQLKLLTIFERLLCVQHIDLFDDFNDCGGHSLLIFTLLIEIKKHIGVLLTTMDVKVATIASLSGIIDGLTN